MDRLTLSFHSCLQVFSFFRVEMIPNVYVWKKAAAQKTRAGTGSEFLGLISLWVLGSGRARAYQIWLHEHRPFEIHN